MFSNPLNEETQARINALIQDILTSFATQFPISYTVALVDKVKAEVNPPTSELDACRLEAAPLPSQPLKTGWLTKRGDAHKNWKKRWVVAYNAADNYRIDYLEGEGGKLKGSINCAGYSTEKFNDDDETQYGPFGIKLVPWQRMRRTWYIRCENEEDRTQWMQTFQACCWKCSAPSDPNPLIAAGFDGAFQATRWKYGYWGWYYSYGGEDERLGDFIRQVLARDIVDAVIGGIPDGFFRSGMVNMVESTIATAVRAAVSAAWKSAVAAVNSLSATIEATAKSNLGPIFEQQKLLKARIVDAISGTTSPFLSDYGGKLLRPVLSGVARPISHAFAGSIRCLHRTLKEKMTSDDLSSGKRKDTLRRLDWEADWWCGGILEESKRILRDMYGDAGAEIFSAGGFSLWNLRDMCSDNLAELFHRATYTLDKLVAENSAVSIVDHATEILRRYVHDAKLYIKYTLLSLLRRLLSSPITQYITTPGAAIVAPIQEMIDAIPIPGLSTLFNLQNLLQETIDETVDNALVATVDGFLADTDRNIDAVTAELVF